MSEYLETTIDKFVFRVATDRLFSVDGVWVQRQANGVRVGLTDYLQQRNGDVAFAHVKPVGAKLAVGDEFAEIETIKANASLFSPVSGTVLEVNAALALSPEIINEAPYDKGWLAVIEAADWHREQATLLTPEAYLSALRSQAEQELSGS
ncbi:MAG: glycine cleavage system protein H [Thermoguttaceae bacterium]